MRQPQLDYREAAFLNQAGAEAFGDGALLSFFVSCFSFSAIIVASAARLSFTPREIAVDAGLLRPMFAHAAMNKGTPFEQRGHLFCIHSARAALGSLSVAARAASPLRDRWSLKVLSKLR